MDHPSETPPSEPTAVVLDQSAPAHGTVPPRTSLGSAGKASANHGRLSRAAWALVGVACVAGAVGVVEVLFPETGPATAESVWQTPPIARDDSTVTTIIATADIDFQQVSAEAMARSAAATSAAAGAEASPSVLGNIVSPDPTAGANGSTGRSSSSGGTTGSGSNTTRSTSTTRATSNQPAGNGVTPSVNTSSTSTTRNNTSSTTTTSTTRNNTSSSSTTGPAGTTTSGPNTSTSVPDDNGGGGGGGGANSGSGGSGGGGGTGGGKG